VLYDPVSSFPFIKEGLKGSLCGEGETEKIWAEFMSVCVREGGEHPLGDSVFLTVTYKGISSLPCIHDDVGVFEMEIGGASEESPYGSHNVIVSLYSMFGDVRVGASSQEVGARVRLVAQGAEVIGGLLEAEGHLLGVEASIPISSDDSSDRGGDVGVEDVAPAVGDELWRGVFPEGLVHPFGSGGEVGEGVGDLLERGVRLGAWLSTGRSL